MRRIVTLAVIFSSLAAVFAVHCAAQNILSAPVDAKSSIDSNHGQVWYRKLDAQWGGHLKLRGSAAWPDKDSFYRPVGTRTYYDGSIEGRLKHKLHLSDRTYFEAHYEVVLSGGDKRRKGKELNRRYGDLPFLLKSSIDDDRRLLNLTRTIREADDYLFYHRLDRLSITWLHDWGVMRLGRQAVTWGNGLLFNPMDLFNPFSPTDIERDYKVGDDMFFSQTPLYEIGDLQLLYVPRRDPDDYQVSWKESSLAGKVHFAAGTTEFDLMAGVHYEDTVLGIGSSGYLADAAWRCDLVAGFPSDSEGQHSYFSIVANIDYAWVWAHRNFYGFLELFYNDSGIDDYSNASDDPNLTQRLARGELFTLGRTYLAGHVQVELHPLLNAYLTVINNLTDPSGILQPRLTWDATQDLQIVLGGNLSYGPKGTEYGGFKVPGLDGYVKAQNSAFFLWLSYFF